MLKTWKVIRKEVKFVSLVHEMLFTKKRNPSLNTQTESIHAKLFV